MKKLQYILLALAFVLAGCNNKDSIWNVMDDMDSRIATLEVLCQEMNTNISALETLIQAQNNGDYITNITEIRNGSTIVGYTITFKNHEPVTIYNGTNGKDGHDGTDGYKPTVGAKQDTDGIYYWTVDGDWLTDANGNKIPVTGEKGDKGDKGDPGDKGQDGKDGHDGANGVNGNTPQLKIDGGYWYISYDGGTNWTQLGKATGEDGTNGTKGDKGEKGDKGDAGDTMFQSVTQDDNYVYFTLADGTLIKIAKNGSGSSTGNQPNSEFLFEVTYDANGGVGYIPNDTFYYGVLGGLSRCNFTKEGYRFANWNTKSDGTGVCYKDCINLIVNKNITLYAQWKGILESLSGYFSVSDTLKVIFSSGNLQYQVSTDTWRFAERQYDYIGDANKNVTDNYDGWMDLFCWGSGNNPATFTTYNTTFVDWGANTISGYAPNTWRTLSSEEWKYIFQRDKYKRGAATIGGVHGVIILPDDGGVLNPTMGVWSSNQYSIEEWEIMENKGAIFLPAAGALDDGSKPYLVANSPGEGGYYWANNMDGGYPYGTYFAQGITSSFSPFVLTLGSTRKRLSVRLVHDVK